MDNPLRLNAIQGNAPIQKKVNTRIIKKKRADIPRNSLRTEYKNKLFN